LNTLAAALTCRETRRSGVSRLLVALAVIAFGLRSLVPAGYMWAPVEGGLAVVACPGHAADAVSSTAAHARHHHQHGSGAASGDGCPFALAGSAVLAAHAPMVAAQHFEMRPLRLPQFDHSAPRSIPPRFLAPRGPPAAA